MVPKGTVFVVANPSNVVHRIKLCNMLQHHLETLSLIYSLPVEFIHGRGDANEEDTADHDRNLQNLLQRCLHRGIVLSPEKMQLRLKRVPFMGHLLTSTGLKPDPAKVEAITNMPKPQDIEGVQHFNGFINYLTKFLPKLSEVMEPIRRLTRKDTPWEWSTEQRQSVSNCAEAGNGSSRCLITTPPKNSPSSAMQARVDLEQLSYRIKDQ